MEYAVGENECWVWQKNLNKKKYGLIIKIDKISYAHRVYYEKYKGKIPEGLVIDHLCKNKSCVNPDHLEAVTQGENTRRALAGKKRQLKKRKKLLKTILEEGYKKVIHKGAIYFIKQ